MNVSLNSAATEALFTNLREANAAFSRRYPGDSGARQPVHTVYGGAHLFKAGSAKKIGAAARQALDDFAPDWIAFARILDLPGAQTLPDAPLEISALNCRLAENSQSFQRENRLSWLSYAVYTRVKAKLDGEPVEDFRIDFEDGYGCRSDAEEDGDAAQVAAEVATGMEQGVLPPFIGIRIKPFSDELMQRSARTLDIFLTELLKRTNGKLPDNFVVTLPKTNIREQVIALVRLLELLESKTGIQPGSLRVELMVESTQSLLNSDGLFNLPLLLKAAAGRCAALHFGAFDYTASCDITAAYQSLAHPSCDLARSMMKMAVGGTGIWLSDGVTNVLPIAPHRTARGAPDRELTEAQKTENQQAVHHAWKLHYDHIQHALKQGIYQGWDLHPAQLPARYAAVYSLFLDGLDDTSVRLKTFFEQAAHASVTGNVFDDAANGQGLLNYFLRALNCGAITMEDARAAGLTPDEMQTRSFLKILNARSK